MLLLTIVLFLSRFSSPTDFTMDPPNLELVPDMVSKIAQELTFARTKIKEMENQAKVSDVNSYLLDFITEPVGRLF